MNAAQIAKKIAESKASGGGTWIKDGHGVLIVKKLVLGDKNTFYAGDTFLAELYVESSEPYKDQNGVNLPTNAVGGTVTFVQQLEKQPDVAYGNTKAFLLALLDETEETLAASAAMHKKEREKNAVPGDYARGLVQQPDGSWGWTLADEFAAVIGAVTDQKNNPCRGMRVRFDTFHKTAKKSGKDLCLARFEAFKPQAPDMVAQARAMLDGTAPTQAA